MAYTRTTWKNGAAGGTPINADRLNNIEQGIAAALAGASVSGSTLTLTKHDGTTITITIPTSGGGVVLVDPTTGRPYIEV